MVIKIFNSLGQEVTTLVDGRLGPGHYSSAWRADKFSSGVYRYRMTAGGKYRNQEDDAPEVRIFLPPCSLKEAISVLDGFSVALRSLQTY